MIERIKGRLGTLIVIHQPIIENENKSVNISSNLATETAFIRIETTIEKLINFTENVLKE